MSGVDRWRVTDALLAMLTTAVSPVLVGDGKAPGSTATPAVLPYLVVEPLLTGGPIRQATVGDVYAGTGLTYQLRSVGSDRRQAQWLADKAFRALFYVAPGGAWTAITGTGISVYGRQPEAAGDVFAEGALWNAVDRITLWCQAA